GNGTGDFSWTPDFTQAGGYDITFYADDGALTDSEIVTITVMGTGALSLDHVDCLICPGDSLPSNQQITFHLRLANDYGISIDGATNSFRVFSPNGAVWDATIGAMTGAITYAMCELRYVSYTADGTTGSGADTVGFGVSRTVNPGIPDGFDEIPYTITIGPISDASEGLLICLDSAFVPPSTVWQWYTLGVGYFFPSWDGPHCYPVGTGPCNQAPVVADIPDQTIAEGSTFTTISLDSYVSDIENLASEMSWSYSGNTELSVSIDINRIATITIPDVNWNGSETITFTATDPCLLSDSDPATFTVTPVNALTLPVPVVAQEQTEWCWAGVARATLLYFSTDVQQCDIVDWTRVQAGWGADDCCNNPGGEICNQPNEFYGAAGSLEDILYNWGVETATHDSALTGAQIENAIDAGTPFLMRWAWIGGGAHMVAGRGYTGSNIHYMDPWPGVGYQTASYEWVVSNPDHVWTHSLCDVCLPPGDGDVDNDGGLSIPDIAYLWYYIYVNGPLPVGGLYVGNTDGCCFVDIGDIGYICNYLYTGGPPPPGSVTCLGSPGGDEVELRLITPPVPGEPDSVIQVDLYVKNNSFIVAASMGFEWDNPNIQMDSARLSPLASNGFGIMANTYYLQSIDSTNTYQHFLLAGAQTSMGGIGASPDSRLWASYYFTASNWTYTSVLRIGPAEFSKGTQLKFVRSGANYVPTFLGDLMYSYEGILRPEPGALVHLEQEYPVEWTESPLINAYNVDLSRNNGSSWENLVTSHVGTTYLWTVSGDTTSGALIRVYDADDPAPVDTMFSGMFTITDAVFVSLTDPGGGLSADAKTGTRGTLDEELKGPGTIPDLLVLYENGTVEFFSGQGDGTFDDTGTFVINADPPATDMALADIDEDGHLDAAISSALTSRVSFHYGVGDGKFTTDPSDTIQTSGSPVDVDFSDFDRDGNVDLLVATESPNQLLIYTGSGDGSFAETPVTLAVAGVPDGIASGHLNDDNITDLAVVHGDSGSVSVFEGSGAGSFDLSYEIATGSAAGGLVISDLNGDGSHDVGVIYPGSYARFMTLINDGTGTFDTTSYATVLGGHSSVLSGDVTGDGLIDVAITSRPNDSLVLLAALPRGGFGYPLLHEVGDEPIQVVCDDFDTNGVADLVVFNRGSQDITVLTGLIQTTMNTDLSVTSPTGGEECCIGHEQIISWTKGEGIASVDVEISRDGDSSWQLIAENITTTSVGWMVNAPATTKGRVRVYDRTVPSRTAMSADYFTILEYKCGDVNGDCKELIDIADLVYLVDYMFNSGPEPPVMEAGDCDGSGGIIDIADLVYLVDYMFNEGPPPVCP
ncbi:MAG: VCBS repeat-containing protein, partial [candidate division Zixibacteria bacterium]|nr:VCBS repeat-containing protein [candidate division Zixibacteria bacterium]